MVSWKSGQKCELIASCIFVRLLSFFSIVLLRMPLVLCFYHNEVAVNLTV